MARCLPPHRCSAAYSAAAANAPSLDALAASAAAVKTLDRDGRHRGSNPRPVASRNDRASTVAGGLSLGASRGPALALALARAALAAASSASASARSASSRARVASARSAFPTCAAAASSRRIESRRTRIPRSRRDTAGDDAPPPFTAGPLASFAARCNSNAAPSETPRSFVPGRFGPVAPDARFSKNSASSASGSSSSSSSRAAVPSPRPRVTEDAGGGGPNAAATTGRAARDPTPMHRKPTRTVSSPAASSSAPRGSSVSSREISSELVARSGAMRVTPPEISVLGCRL